MLPLRDSFFDPSQPSLKVCGVTTGSDAAQLADLGVDALGVNFWEKSKRYCPPDDAAEFLPALKGRILRVGVFVNADPDLPHDLLERDLLDVVQFHGDESQAYCHHFAKMRLPFIKATSIPPGTSSVDELPHPSDYETETILLDAHAPGIYGGTGETTDWKIAREDVTTYGAISILLAGGITPENTSAALEAVGPAALDVASGAESAPGTKDFAKVEALLKAVRAA